jgi:hypothetical protein
MVDGEFSSNVGKSPNHNSSSLSQSIANQLRKPIEPIAAGRPTSSDTHRCEHSWAKGRDRFGDGAGSAPDNQEPSHYLLAGANFDEGAESSRVQVDAEGLLVRVEFPHGCHDDCFKVPPES